MTAEGLADNRDFAHRQAPTVPTSLQQGGSDVRSDDFRDVIDPDVDLHDPQERDELSPHRWDILAAIAAGGVIGAEARYGLAELFPHPTAAWPWSTFITNAVGSLLIGVLMILLLEVQIPHRLARPFLGVGVLGGFTTFSTFAIDVHQMLLAHRLLVALTYVLASLAACLGAVAVAGALTRVITRRGAGS
jgi:CrcB protein